MKKILAFFLDAIFPKLCVGCRKEGVYLCPDCRLKLRPFEEYSCPLCSYGHIPYQVCHRCHQKTSLARIIITHSYRDRKVERLISFFKHRYIIKIDWIVWQAMIESIKMVAQNDPVVKQWISFPANIIIIPVPLHKKRERQRGFNQSHLIAQHVAAHFGWKLFNILHRKRNTQSQTELTRTKRLTNLKNTFVLKNSPPKLTHGHVILLDDVLTTGATLSECARALLPLHPRSINGLVFAKNK